jgi:hypothetical protein
MNHTIRTCKRPPYEGVAVYDTILDFYLFQTKYTGIPNSIIPNPGQVYYGLKIGRSVEMAEVSKI